ncbi:MULTISPECIES: hypothetical protein [Brevibacillus]|jgi:hypothetical protein|nr:hypothetical protein [Brevibacillus borstelensis]MED1745011.1 hypothetical protein [Brevibacillus borstelensis]MED1854813.1 hypothetical protein [Brevibacillus borstelensis]MED1876269.1 hypothetical protein [Brevibacillus borstelensis]MED2010318.1 hypothetical protein [Brevibacillus borstelensis]
MNKFLAASLSLAFALALLAVPLHNAQAASITCIPKPNEWWCV